MKIDRECSYPDFTISIFVVALTLPSFRLIYTQRLRNRALIILDEVNFHNEIRYLGKTITWADLKVA